MKVLIRFPADHNMLSFLALAMPIPLDFTTLREALEADPYTKQITANLASNPSSHPVFSMAAHHLIINLGWLFLIILSSKLKFSLKHMTLQLGDMEDT